MSAPARVLAGACIGLLCIGLSFVAAYADAAGVRIATVTRVVDGDTFAVVGEAFPLDCGPTGQKRYCDTKIRVRNFDTAELRQYDCAEERVLAVEARAVARDILLGADVTLVVTDVDRHGRPVADVWVHRGEARVDFVEAMVRRGAGARWRYGAEPQPDWCRGAAARAPETTSIAARLGRWLERMWN